MSTKGEILKQLAEMDAVDGIELTDRLKRVGVHTNPLTVTTLVWDLQKQQLVTFDERNGHGTKTPTHIHLTDRGREIAFRAKPFEEEPKVPTVAVETIADRIEKAMLDAGPEKTWGPMELVAELALTQKHAGPAVSTALSRDKRFVRANQKGIWTLRIWESRFRQAEPEQPAHEHIGVDHYSASKVNNGRVAPGGPIERIKPSDSQPVAGVIDTPRNGTEPVRQNEKPAAPPPGLLDGLALVTNLLERSEKRGRLIEAARMLESAGEDELAIQTLARVELTALEEEVVELVRRVRGQGGNAPREVHSGVAG